MVSMFHFSFKRDSGVAVGATYIVGDKVGVTVTMGERDGVTP